MATPIKLVVGLGNPGSQYEKTRHNAGFWFLDELVKQLSADLRLEKKFHGATGRSHQPDCRLLKPDTFMNRSGLAVAAFSRFYSISPAQILIVHDELDLSPGIARLKKTGGHGGNNGLRDIIQQLGTKDFMRLRLGVGHPGDRNLVTNYLTQRTPPREERDAIDAAISNALAVMPDILAGEFDRAMNQLH